MGRNKPELMRRMALEEVEVGDVFFLGPRCIMVIHIVPNPWVNPILGHQLRIAYIRRNIKYIRPFTGFALDYVWSKQNSWLYRKATKHELAKASELLLSLGDK